MPVAWALFVVLAQENSKQTIVLGMKIPVMRLQLQVTYMYCGGVYRTVVLGMMICFRRFTHMSHSGLEEIIIHLSI